MVEKYKLMKKEQKTLIDLSIELFDQTDLNGVYLLGAQHILPSTFEMIKALIDIGLTKENISLIGKCYSTNPKTFQKMRSSQIDVCSSSVLYDPSKLYKKLYQKNLLQFMIDRLSKIEIKKTRKIIVLDDGGQLIKLIQHNPIRNKIPIVGIEQTTSGYELLKTNPINIPIINVARSELKIIHESPIIGRIVVNKLISFIEKYSLDVSKILIIGNGSIGSSIGNQLKYLFEVDFFDINPDKTNISLNTFSKELEKYDVIIGATGSNTIKLDQISNLNKPILVSASSYDSEFDIINERVKYNKNEGCHEDIKTPHYFLLNSGFPINFDNDYETIDPPEMHLTRALLITSLKQALNTPTSNKEIIPLDIEYQRDLLRKYKFIFPTHFRQLIEEDGKNRVV